MRALRPASVPACPAARRRRRAGSAAPRCVGVRFSDPPQRGRAPPRRADDPAGDALRGPRDACQTPHSGYHDDGARRRFFEGWRAPCCAKGSKRSACAAPTARSATRPRSQQPSPRAARCRGRFWLLLLLQRAAAESTARLSLTRRYFRVTLPLSAGSAPGGDSFAFMFSCEDATGGSDGRGALSGVGAQVMGPGDAYLCCHARDVAPFWAWRHRLGLGHAFATAGGAGTAKSAKAHPQALTRAGDTQRRRRGRWRRRPSLLTWQRASSPPPRGIRRAPARCALTLRIAPLRLCVAC